MIGDQNSSLRVALLWNGTVVSEQTFTRMSAPGVFVGESARNHFIAPTDRVPDSFEMFTRRRDGVYVLELTDELSGDLELDGEPRDIESLRTSARVELSQGDWGTIELGEYNQLFFQVLDEVLVAPRRNVFGAVTGLSAALASFIALSGVVHAAFLLAAFLSYNPDAQLDPLFIENRFAQFDVQDIKEPEPEEPEEEAVDDSEELTAKRAEGEEGKFGAEEAEVEESKLADVDGPLAKEIDATNIGVNEALSSELLGSGPLKNIFGNQGGFDSKIKVAMNGEGGDIVVGRGANGMGMRGTGNGGGGKDGFGRIAGIGSVDTGNGQGIGARIKKRPKKKIKPVVLHPPQISGDFCDKKNIRRVVGAKANAIKYCFEKELQSKPELAGKIIAQWNVGLDGSVMNASIASSTMKDSNVEGCITRVVKRMRFQKPNGGICVINYPFLFSGLE